MIKIIIGLICVMIANILLGVTLAKLKKEFNKNTLLESLVKYLGIIIGICLVYLAGYLNENIMVASIDGVEVNLMTGIKTLFVAGIIYYGGQDLIKIKDLLGVKSVITPSEESKG